MSSSIALRRSPKPGAFTATHASVPRSLLTTSVASASPSTSSAMRSERAPLLRDVLEDGQEILHDADPLVVDEDERVLEDALHPLGIGHEVRREVAAIELHPLDDLDGGLGALRLLDRDDALAADLLDRVADELADRGVVVGGDRRDLNLLLPARDRARQLAHDVDGDARVRGRARA